MRPITHIRRNVFGLSQAAFGAIVGMTQATVSRWETGELEPGQTELERIRAAALKQKIKWDDRWFFEVPENAE